MKRKVYKELLKWKNTKNFKILFVLGVRQCGKTYIIRKFIQNEYKHYKEINLFDYKQVIDLYNSDLTSEEKYNRLKLLIDFDFEQEDSILFIDEIQKCDALISDMKYIKENHKNVRIICAGSLLGVRLAKLRKAFPVGKITRIYMYPMDFEEFLVAYNKENLVEEIKKCFNNNKAMGKPIHEKIIEYYRRYLVSGGMPDSVLDIIEKDNNYINYNTQIVKDIIEDYQEDMNDHDLTSAEVLKVRKIYNSLPSQLENASKKFQYSNIEKKARGRDYEFPLNWLENSNMIQICKLCKKPESPLDGFADEDSFKVYYSDIGIFNQIVGNKVTNIITDNLGIYKGIMTENYVANQLKSNGIDLYYWKGPRNSEIDFLIDTKDGIIPIEVKANDNTQSKSLKVYSELYKPKYTIRISTKDFGYNPTTKIKSIPLYATYLLKELQIK